MTRTLQADLSPDTLPVDTLELEPDFDGDIVQPESARLYIAASVPGGLTLLMERTVAL